MRAILMGVAASLATVASAHAVTYLGHRAVGTATVDFTIVTDDTLGVLTEDNILDWAFKVSNNGETAQFGGPGSGDNSSVDILGTAFTATAGGLFFDFSAVGTQYVAFVSDFRQSWCLQTNGCWDFGGPKETAAAGQFATNSQTAPRGGVQQVASAAPEPATWALMLLGFGAAGAAIRARRVRLAA